MHIDCTGSGTPVLVLEAGGQNDSSIWRRVQPELSKTTTVCSYDRAGFGWSDDQPGPRDADHIASELHALLAQAGVNVLVVEKKHLPREKTCGDGLTPRSVRQLEDMGLGDELAGRHRFDGLRSVAFGRELLMPWPEAPGFGGYGYVITRKDLDALVAERAQKAGATVWEKAEATTPIVSNGLLRGAKITRKTDPSAPPVEVRADYTVVADGAMSRFGRGLGAPLDGGNHLAR